MLVETGTRSGFMARNSKEKIPEKPCLSLLKKSPKNSPVWNQLISVKDLYTSGRKISVGRGDSTSFWKDSWIGDTP